MSHDEPFEGAGATYALRAPGITASQVVVEDWWDRVSAEPWSRGNPAAVRYAFRRRSAPFGPHDEEVVYGKVGGLDVLVHVSELRGRVS